MYCGQERGSQEARQCKTEGGENERAQRSAGQGGAGQGIDPNSAIFGMLEFLKH
jgi:hypothetical protein